MTNQKSEVIGCLQTTELYTLVQRLEKTEGTKEGFATSDRKEYDYGKEENHVPV